MLTWRFAWLVALLLAVSACTTLRELAGFPAQGDPSVAIKPAETRWLLIKNPRFGDVPSEPEYIWVEEDKVPLTFKTFFRGKSAIIAPPEVVARYGAPPGGGKISPRQGAPYQVSAAEPAKAEAKPAAGPVVQRAGAPAVPEAAKRGYVVYVDTNRIVIDLVASDGVRLGAVVSLRRDRIPIVHPVTGEVLGSLDEEVATARVTEVRDKFSVAEIQAVAPGSQVQVKDRVIPK